MEPETSYKTEVAPDRNKSSPVPKNYTCIRCGAKAKHLAKNCFAIKLTCKKCSKQGHLAKVCKSGLKARRLEPSEHQCNGRKARTGEAKYARHFTAFATSRK
ncbi:hypothetical protein HAZT_HAZT008757 [Hyalella azteca]|uniref:CCHC-type domain-containing protein n=1 Tax=Hyalella azteca TaxID=294128 RepID=A0A6A0GZK1_HYAAZ|nr:hypothetical protein HAZT_HAZT008757 [Hyalella azteca]